jgi:hypothetical protein
MISIWELQRVAEMTRGIWPKYVNLFLPDSQLISCRDARVMLAFT